MLITVFSYVIVIMYIIVYFHVAEYCSIKIGTQKRNYLWSVFVTFSWIYTKKWLFQTYFLICDEFVLRSVKFECGTFIDFSYNINFNTCKLVMNNEKGGLRHMATLSDLWSRST